MGINEKELLEEIQMMGRFAVQYHKTLQEIYDWALEVKRSMAHAKGMESLMDILIEKCLDGGLYEIHGG